MKAKKTSFVSILNWGYKLGHFSANDKQTPHTPKHEANKFKRIIYRTKWQNKNNLATAQYSRMNTEARKIANTATCSKEHNRV